jgi:hypothetical protein
MEFDNRWKEYKVSPSNQKESMSRRDFCWAQIAGVLFVSIGFTAGILVGIYVYHGGPDAEVNCKV